MTCACGRPVHIKKRGLCQGCYLKWWASKDNTTRKPKPLSRTTAKRLEREHRRLNDPTWKRKGEIQKAEKLLRKVYAGRVKSPNPLTRICNIERKAIQQVAKDAPVIQGWRDGMTLEANAAQFNITRERVRQKLIRWGLPSKSPFKPVTNYRRLLTPDEKVSRRAARTARAVIEFWQKVDRSNPEGCWPWTGYTWPTNKNHPEYLLPRYSKGGHFGEKPTTYAYRVAYILGNGPIPEGMTVDHICFNPLCCNPAHLQILTRGANAARKDPRKKRGGELYKERQSRKAAA